MWRRGEGHVRMRGQERRRHSGPVKMLCAGGGGGDEGHVLKDTTAAAYVDESGNLALVNPGDGEIVSKEVGEEERGTGGCVDRRGGDATVVTPSKVEGESLSPVCVSSHGTSGVEEEEEEKLYLYSDDTVEGPQAVLIKELGLTRSRT